MLANLGRDAFSNWRKECSFPVQPTGPELNPGGSNDPSGRWWLFREGKAAIILRENGAKELYWMKSDPHSERSKARTAKQSLINRLTDTVKAMRQAEGTREDDSKRGERVVILTGEAAKDKIPIVI